jgi:hypothetical protein
MSTTTNTITYRKTKNGDWVAFGPADMIQPGKLVIVTKRDGSTKEERVESVGKTFDVNGRPHVYGYLVKQVSYRPATHKATRRQPTGRCVECGGHVQSFSEGAIDDVCFDCV